MKIVHKLSLGVLLITVVSVDARVTHEQEIDHEAISSVLEDDPRMSKKQSDVQEKTTALSFDFSKVNSSTERPMLNIDMIYDQIDALERHLAGVSAQVQALKAQVREARHVAQEQYDAEKKQTQSLLAQLNQTREKLNQSQQLLAIADARQQQLEAQVAQLAQVEKPVASTVAAVVDGQVVTEIPEKVT